jgi:glycosyltransferase involved in cell wall biosynthesis
MTAGFDGREGRRVRIGIDMLAVQSPDSRGRGVGRYGRNLVAAMLAQADGHEYVLYAHDGFVMDEIPSAPHARFALLRPEAGRGEVSARDAIDRLARENPHDLDVLLLLNPFELHHDYDPPARPLAGLRIAAVVHDLIPFLFPDQYLYEPAHAGRMYRRLRIIRHYDAILTNSEATRRDCLRLLRLPAARAVTIGGAGDGAFFKPDRSWPLSMRDRRRLRELGVDRRFVFCVSGMDERKNLRGLIEAFSLLPPGLRRHHQLVVTCWMAPCHVEEYGALASRLGVGENLVLTNVIDDEHLRVLYQRCAAFVFPSRYEGLGLPILEAMHCGAAVVAGNNSSQVEVLGDAGLLANAADPADIAARMGRVLSDPSEATRLGELAVNRAAGFTWEATARTALDALGRVVRGRTGPARDRPRLAVFSPWPPKATGIADYAGRLVDHLRGSFTIDLVHEPGYVPEPALGRRDLASVDHRLFPRHARAKGYHGVLYQMGNSYYHEFVYQGMIQHGGIVTLHDFNLAGFHHWRSHASGQGDAALRAEVEYAYGRGSAEILARLDAWSREPGGLQEAFTRRCLDLNRRVFDESEAVIVHSPWCFEQVAGRDARHAEKTFVIPLGATARPLTAAQRAGIRARFGLSPDARVIGGYGILSQAKMNVEAIEAFAALADAYPSALLLFVGQDWEDGQARRAVAALGLVDRVRFLGRASDADFADLVAVADIGLALRRPPTYGETSAALLDLLRHGVATIVTDVATFSAYPDAIVRKVRWDEDGPARLVAALRELLDHPERRAALGEAAARHVESRHSWPRIADQYAEVINRVASRRPSRRRLATA